MVPISEERRNAADRMIEPLTGLPTTPTRLALLAVPIILMVFLLAEVLEGFFVPNLSHSIPPLARLLHLVRGFSTTLVFAFLAAWAVGRNWARALRRIRAAEARARAAERARMERERLAALGRIAAGVAHEIGNPLASISAICQLIEKKGADPRLPDRIRLVRTEVDRIAGIVRNLLDFARPMPRDPTRIPITPLLDRAAEMVRVHERMDGIDLTTRVDPPNLSIRGDAGALEQILLNLAWNAVEAIREANGSARGRVRISARAGADGDTVFETIDDGPGVSEENQERIFDPFFTTKEMGTGLGLSVVHGLVEDAGGRIEVGRSEWGGARFRVVLPGEDP